MMGSIVAGALAFGFLGSLHCAFMCGPLALAGCSTRGAFRPSSAALYFGGRLTSYMFAGAAFGALGAHLGCWIHLDDLQRVLLTAVAIVALVKGIRLALGRSHSIRPMQSVQLKRPSRMRRAARFVASLVPRRALSLGLVTGALPCGLLAGAWGLAAATGHPGKGALVMCAFSFATAPALAGSLLVGRFARYSRFASSTRAQGVLWCALGLWIVARSLLPHGAHEGGH